jgi:hypothetical protein
MENLFQKLMAIQNDEIAKAGKICKDMDSTIHRIHELCESIHEYSKRNKKNNHKK